MNRRLLFKKIAAVVTALGLASLTSAPPAREDVFVFDDAVDGDVVWGA